MRYLICLIFLRILYSADAELEDFASDISVCVGQNATLKWRYKEDGMTQVNWLKNDSIIMVKINSKVTILDNASPNIRHVENGEIMIVNSSLNDSGVYGIIVHYLKQPTAQGNANVSIKASPSSIKYSEIDLDSKTKFTCLVDHLGVPPVHVQIKVGTELKETNTETVDLTLPVYCCMVGGAAACLPANTFKNTTYCENIHIPYGPENLRLTPMTSEYTLDISDELNGINCSADCLPNCEYVWDKDGSDILFDSYLSPRTIHSGADRGNYTCTATRSVGHERSMSITVYVRYGPDKITFNPPGLQHDKTENDVLDDIVCQAECYPECSYSWKKNGKLVSQNHLLSLGTLQKGENGTYLCTAVNTFNHREENQSIIIIVKYGPDDVILDPADKVYEKPETVNLLPITCLSQCFPDCVYNWTKFRTVISNNNTLALGILQRDEKGTYTCTATNPSTGSSKKTTVTIHVQYGPDDVFINHTCQNCTEDEGYTLPEIRCKAQCYHGCSYRWTKNGTHVSSNASLILGTLDRNKAGKYICTANNTDIDRMANGSIIINVRYGPDEIIFNPPSTKFNLSEGELFPVKSCTSDCYPGCSQSWENVRTGTYLGTEKILALGIVYRNDTAEYRCTSLNQALQKSTNDSIFLTVKYFPEVKVSKVEDEITELNKSFTIECASTGIPDTYKYFNWTHFAPDGLTKVNVHKGQVVSKTLRLTKEHPSYMDSGVYLCRVTNGEREYPSNNKVASSALNVTVKGKPLVTESDPIVDGATGKHVKLNVSYFSNDETNPSVTWFKIVNDTRSQLNISSDGKFQEMSYDVTVIVRYADDVSINQKGKKTQLEITNIEEADFGYYETEIVNSIGNLNHRLELVPRGPPSLPTNLTVINGSETSTSITLMWIPGFHGGANQTFCIEYKTNSTQWVKRPCFPGGKSSDLVNATVRDLLSGTKYKFKLYAKNEYGRKNVSIFVTGTTARVKTAEDQVTSPNVGLIAGGAAGGVVLAAIIVVLAVLFLRRRQSYLKSPSKRLLKDKKRPVGVNGADDTPEVNVNPMYEPAGPPPSTPDNGDVYSEVNKNRKNEKFVGGIYSQVQKPDKLQKSGGVGVTNDVYAKVQKKTHKSKDAGDSKHKTQKRGIMTKKGKEAEGDLYDNVDTINSTVTKGKNVYENPSCGTEDEHSKQKNQDGLIYVDLDLPKETVGINRKAVIHGLDDRTDYADIRFGEVGEQPPESDEEEKIQE